MTQVEIAESGLTEAQLVEALSVGLRRCYLSSSSSVGADLEGASLIVATLDKLGDIQPVIDAIGSHQSPYMIQVGLRILILRSREGTLVPTLRAAGFLASDFEKLNSRLLQLQSKAWNANVKQLALELGVILGYE
jgi:hypothetical protein